MFESLQKIAIKNGCLAYTEDNIEYTIQSLDKELIVQCIKAIDSIFNINNLSRLSKDNNTYSYKIKL